MKTCTLWYVCHDFKLSAGSKKEKHMKTFNLILQCFSCLIAIMSHSERYIDYVVTSGVKLTIGVDELYEKYVLEFIPKDVTTALERS